VCYAVVLWSCSGADLGGMRMNKVTFFTIANFIPLVAVLKTINYDNFNYELYQNIIDNFVCCVPEN